jgi:hypothetical protein
MKEVTTVGVDLAKAVFTMHGVDVAGRTVLRKTVRREKLMEFMAALPPCLIGMEACGGAPAASPLKSSGRNVYNEQHCHCNCPLRAALSIGARRLGTALGHALLRTSRNDGP